MYGQALNNANESVTYKLAPEVRHRFFRFAPHSLCLNALLRLLQTYPYSRTKALAEQDVIAANAKGKALLLCR